MACHQVAWEMSNLIRPYQEVSRGSSSQTPFCNGRDMTKDRTSEARMNIETHLGVDADWRSFKDGVLIDVLPWRDQFLYKLTGTAQCGTACSRGVGGLGF